MGMDLLESFQARINQKIKTKQKKTILETPHYSKANHKPITIDILHAQFHCTMNQNA